jgi:Bacterial EndoU nuclease
VHNATYASDLEAHITTQDLTVARANGIGGAHNLEAFEQALMDENGAVVRITQHPTLAGVQRIEYQLPALDCTGTMTGGFKAQVYYKTVYDPVMISDAEFLAWGKEAALEAEARGALTREWTGTASNGVAYRGCLNSAGEVHSFCIDF